VGGGFEVTKAKEASVKSVSWLSFMLVTEAVVGVYVTKESIAANIRMGEE
jgi:hypothetical protein